MLGEVVREIPWGPPPLTIAIHLSVAACGIWLVTSQLLDVGIRGPLWSRDLRFLANELPLIGLWGFAGLVCSWLALKHLWRACLDSPALILGRRGLRLHGLSGVRSYAWEDVALCQPSPWRDFCFRAFRVLPEQGHDALWFYSLPEARSWLHGLKACLDVLRGDPPAGRGSVGAVSVQPPLAGGAPAAAS